jgi:hypothetical protein
VLRSRWPCALVTEPIEGREDERRYRRAVKKIGRDPHLAYANMLADVAYIREDRRCQMLFVDEPVQTRARAADPIMEQVYDVFPEMRPRDEERPTCGTCSEFDSTREFCRYRQLYTKATELSCEAYCP